MPAGLRSKKFPPMIDHVIRSIVRFPTRTVRSTLRAVNPRYRVQWEADRAIKRWPRQLRRDLESVSGTSTSRECRLLAHLLIKSPPGGVVVEIGALKGKTTAWLVEAAQRRSDRPLVVSIDPHIQGTWDEYNRTLGRFSLRARGLEVHQAMSHDIGLTWNRPISMLWIDGGHDYETVVQDINDFIPHVLPTGWVVFDDAAGGEFPGVEQAIHDRMPAFQDFRQMGTLKDFQLFRRQPA